MGICQSIYKGLRNEMTFFRDQLCSQCARINFDFFTRSFPKDPDNEMPSDISWSKLHSEYCQFCQLLAHCRHHCQDIGQPLLGSLRGVYTGHELQLYVDDEKTSRRLDYSIRHCEPEPKPSSHPNEEPQSSRSFDVKELKLWLDRCGVHKCLPDDHSHDPLPEDFRLIDVENACIVRPKTHVKYCALSYVWGTDRKPTFASGSTLESKRSLDALEFPRTIRDAMAFCKDIRCPFLWVDSLCMTEEDKHRQILSMADIYSHSFLAIIAATGPDADAGLPPYGSLERRRNISYLVRSISKGSFVATLSPQIAAQDIAKSSWASRGWTLQEYALSRRVLFFTGSYTYLRCEKGLWCEDFGLGFSNCFDEDVKWDLPLPPFYRRMQNPDRYYSSTFSQILAQFIRRSLRYEDDILAAFMGILTRMEDSIGTHLWGLPSKEFGAALQWTTNLPCPSTPRFGFPSWSWAGWIHTGNAHLPDGSLPDMYEGFDNRVTDMSAVTCYRVEDDKVVYTVEEFNLERISLQLKKARLYHQHPNEAKEIARLETELRQNFTPHPCSEIQTYIELQNPFRPPLSQHIFLWASCSSLYVDRPSEDNKHLKTWDFPIRFKNTHQPIGSIRLKPSWREKEPDNMKFFVSTLGVYSHPVQVKFKVILIRPHDDMKPLVYKRIQVSHVGICGKDWALAEPESRLIALV